MNDHDQSDNDLDRLLAHANPVSDADAARWVVEGRFGELADDIAADDPTDAPVGEEIDLAAIDERPRRWRRLMPITAAAAAAAVAFAVVGLPGADEQSPDGTSEDGVAYAASLVAMAERAPRLLIDDPDWEVTYADEQQPGEGEMLFTDGTDEVTLYWSSGSVQDGLEVWTDAVAVAGDVITPTGIATLLDVGPADAVTVPAPSSTSPATHPPTVPPTTMPSTTLSTAPLAAADTAAAESVPDTGPRSTLPAGAEPFRPTRYVAVWSLADPTDGALIEFRTTVADVDEVRDLLAATIEVDVETWLAAMPDSVVTSADQPDAIAERLEGVPLPAGFDPTSIDVGGEITDGYQLTATVSGGVVCAWLDHWFAADEAGDDEAKQEVADPLASSTEWPMLLAIEDEGGWAQKIWEWADAVNGGPGIATGGGAMPPSRDLAAGIGCDFA